MRLSDTADAQVWLGQFEEHERTVGQQLLDDLTIVTPAALTVEMNSLVRRAIGDTQEPVALYPIWEVQTADVEGAQIISPGESIFGESGEADNRGDKDASLPDNRSEQISAPINPISGSVGFFVSLITNLIRQFGPNLVLDRPSLAVLRKKKCHKILLLDDVVGSGQRVISYLEAFYRHPTIKSWVSSKRIEISVVCLAASERALARIDRYRPSRGHTRPHPVQVVYDQVLLHGRSFWRPSERRRIEEVCRKYARRTTHRNWPFGYQNAFSMIVLPYGIPNNTPAILWAEGIKKPWVPLFRSRVIPDTLLQQFDQIQRDPAGELLSEMLARVNQLRLSGHDWSRYARPEYRELILLLGALSLGLRRPKRIMDILEITPTQLKELLSVAKGFMLIDESGALTRRGVQELDYARTIGVTPPEVPPHIDSRFYFPTSLKIR